MSPEQPQIDHTLTPGLVLAFPDQRMSGRTGQAGRSRHTRVPQVPSKYTRVRPKPCGPPICLSGRNSEKGSEPGRGRGGPHVSLWGSFSLCLSPAPPFPLMLCLLPCIKTIHCMPSTGLCPSHAELSPGLLSVPLHS